MNNSTYCAVISFPSVIFLPPLFSIFVSSFGVWTSMFLMKVLSRNSGSLPNTVKYIMLNVSLLYVIRNIYFLYKACHTLLSFFIGLDSMILPYELCVFEQTFYLATSVCRYLSFFYISLNRLHATISKKTALKHSADEPSVLKYVCFLIATTWLPSLLYYCTIIMLAKSLTTPALCFCYFTNLLIPAISNFHNIFCISIQIVTALIYSVVYRKNREILEKFTVTTIKGNLNERFVQWANVKVSKWLIPLTLISVAMNVSSVSLSTTLRAVWKLDFFDATTLALGVLAAFSLEAQLFPLICIRLSPMLLQGIRQQHPQICKYFDLFNSDSSVQEVSWATRRATGAITHGSSAKVAQRQIELVGQKFIKTVGNLTDGRMRIVDHRMNPDAQAAMLNEMWGHTVDPK